MTQRSLICRSVLVAGIAGLSLGGCSFSTGKSPTKAAIELIEGQLAEQAGMVFTEPACEAPADDEVGTTFTCTAKNAAGETVTFDGIIDPDDMIFVAPSNLLDADEMSLVEQEAADTLGPEVGAEIDPADVACPDETTVLVDSKMMCEITDAATGDRFELTVTFDGFVLREGYGDRNYSVGDKLN